MLGLAMCLQAQAQAIDGTWHGDLNAGVQKLGIVFHFGKDAGGERQCSMDVPVQGAADIAVTVSHCSADSVNLRIPIINASYTGKLQDGVIKGTFMQNGMTFPLDLTHGTMTRPNRPQEPKAPFPYQTEEVTFTNKSAQVTLAGTLTYPQDYNAKHPVPVVLMVTGSGAQTRNETVFEHKPFWVIADYLAKHGIASLRYDDRGTGLSTGKFEQCTSVDFAADAKAGLVWLKNSGKFARVGVLGHSEGGLIAFMLGADKSADFIVSLAGPGIKGDTLLAEQHNAAMRLYGQPASETVKTVRARMAAMSENRWLNYFLDFDPAPTIAKIKIPVMAVNGEKDRQVIAQSNLRAIEKLLKNANKKNLIKEYPELNHLFQHCTTGATTEYFRIEETCSPQVLQDIATWINGL